MRYKRCTANVNTREGIQKYPIGTTDVHHHWITQVRYRICRTNSYSDNRRRDRENESTGAYKGHGMQEGRDRIEQESAVQGQKTQIGQSTRNEEKLDEPKLNRRY